MGLDKLLEGIVHFRQKDFEQHRELFKDLGNSQNPHTLFITCSDSRLVPNMLTGTLPGEIFVLRNIANLVPPYSVTDYEGTASAVEYAVLSLEVKHIIVCGHSNCGGCAAGLHPEKIREELGHTRKWLELMQPVRERVWEELGKTDEAANEWLMEQENVVEQLHHLLTYPYVRERVESGALTLDGWHYIIETGEIYVYDADSSAFVLANG